MTIQKGSPSDDSAWRQITEGSIHIVPFGFLFLSLIKPNRLDDLMVRILSVLKLHHQEQGDTPQDRV